MPPLRTRVAFMFPVCYTMDAARVFVPTQTQGVGHVNYKARSFERGAKGEQRNGTKTAFRRFRDNASSENYRVPYAVAMRMWTREGRRYV
jgi:hypothetical protein